MSTVTLEEVWALFKAADQRLQKHEQWLKEQALEYDKMRKEYAQEAIRHEQEATRREQEYARREQEREQEAARREQEYARREQEREQEAARREQEYARREQEREQEAARREQEREQEAARREREAERRMQELDRAFKETDKKIGKLGNRLGEFVESMIKPGLINLLQAHGIEVYILLHDVESKRPGAALEIDLLAVNTTDCVAVEVKSKLTQADVDKHIERLNKFKIALPHYQDCRVMGAVAAMVLSEEVVAYAMKQGFFVLAQQGENIEIINKVGFQARVW